MERTSRGPAVPDGGQTPASDEVFCTECGSIIKEQAEICPECGVRQLPKGGEPADVGAGPGAAVQPGQGSATAGGDDPMLAAVLSLVVPGLGQFYNGDHGRGIAIFLGIVISFPLMALAVGFLTLPALWVWGVYDAYHAADQ